MMIKIMPYQNRYHVIYVPQSPGQLNKLISVVDVLFIVPYIRYDKQCYIFS